MINCNNCGFGHKTTEELKACKPWSQIVAEAQARGEDVFGNRLPIEQENMSTEANPDPYQIEHTVIGRKMLGQ